MYDINKVQIPNTFQNPTNIVKPKETITYTLNYKTNKSDKYEIYFYSGIVDNNIKFTITNTDITDESNTEIDEHLQTKK